MSIAHQLEGERIAKEVTAKHEALELICAHSKKFSLWHYGAAIVTGGGIGAANAFAGEHAQLLVGILAGIGFCVGGAAFQECLCLRRRLDAAIVLLLKDAIRN